LQAQVPKFKSQDHQNYNQKTDEKNVSIVQNAITYHMCTYYIEYIESIFYIYGSIKYRIVKSGLIFKNCKNYGTTENCFRKLKLCTILWCSIFLGQNVEKMVKEMLKKKK
jgi:hypothetical protein